MLLEPTPARLAALGLDVLTEIFHFVHDLSRSNIFSLLRVNKLFYGLALPLTVRECGLSFDDDEIQPSHARIEQWLEPDSNTAWVLPNVKRLTIFGTPGKTVLNAGYSTRSQDEKWEPVLRLIPFLLNLIHFTFACPSDRVPVSLLQVLEATHPHVGLSVKYWGIGNDRALIPMAIDPDETALVSSSLLRSIEKDHQIGALDISYAVLKWVIANSKSLHFDSLIVNHVKSVYVQRGWGSFRSSRVLREQELQVATKFPMPSTLPKHKFRILHLLHAPSEFADFCINVGELTFLEELHCSFPFQSLVDAETGYLLTSLRRLDMIISHSNVTEQVFHQLEGLLTQCGPLEALSLTSQCSLSRLLPFIVAHHGPTLHKLEVLHTPTRYSEERVIPSSASDIILIQGHCPHLRDLALATTRGPHVFEVSELLGRFTSLLSITLVFPEDPNVLDDSGSYLSQFKNEEFPQDDKFDEWEAAVRLQLPVHSSFASKMFEDIIEGGGSLQRLTVKLGDPAVRTTAQEFIVEFGSKGRFKETAKGYILPEDTDMDWVLDTEPPRPERLRRLCRCLLPNMTTDMLHTIQRTPRSRLLYGQIA
ncbi:hypothetical protein DL96DRAFT_1623643 [Flagelloscypha sp. PMI_526]|nr:hypothetical protein DL96DRAFT_1623643 [Flagelloscypha sp. PMI_526]